MCACSKLNNHHSNICTTPREGGFDPSPHSCFAPFDRPPPTASGTGKPSEGPTLRDLPLTLLAQTPWAVPRLPRHNLLLPLLHPCHQ